MTNTASRLTESASDGEIVVDADTYQDVALAFWDATRAELAL